MTYDDAVLEYAQFVMVYSPDGKRLLALLDKKITEYSIGYDLEEAEDEASSVDTGTFKLPSWVLDEDKKQLINTLKNQPEEVRYKYLRRNFWTLVKAVFQRKECYVDLERLRNLERYHRDTKVFYELKTASSPSRNTYEWIKMLPKMEDYVEDTLSYRDALDENFSTSESERNACTADSLRFWYDSFEHIGGTDEGQFYYLPLMLWSLENLIIYSKYSITYSEDLLNFFIPVLRKHRIACNAFAALIEAEPGSSELKESTVFNDRYNCVKVVADDGSIGVDMFTSGLQHALETGDFRRLDLADAKSLRTKFPLYCMFRSLYTAEQMNIDDIYRYVVPTEVAVLLYRQCETQRRTYTQQNIASLILSGVHEVMSRPTTDQSLRNPAIWEGTVEIAQRAVKNLLEASILTPETGLAIGSYLRKANATMIDGFHHGKTDDGLSTHIEFVLSDNLVQDNEVNADNIEVEVREEPQPHGKKDEDYEAKQQEKFLDLYWHAGVSDEEVAAAYEYFERRYSFIEIDELDYDPLHVKVRTVGGEFFGTFAYAMKNFKY